MVEQWQPVALTISQQQLVVPSSGSGEDATGFPLYDHTVATRRRQGPGSRLALRDAVLEKDKHPLHFWSNDRWVVIYDGYPKASVHLLVMPTDLSLRRVSCLVQCHIPLLRELQALSGTIVQHLRRTTHHRLRLQTGFHRRPSFEPLHLHITSLDFERSPHTKHIKHYASFLPPFFVSLPEVINSFETSGARISEGDASTSSASLRRDCFWCRAPFASFPTLKAHLAECTQRATHDSVVC